MTKAQASTTGMPDKHGEPPAPREKLGLEDTRDRTKAIIGGQSGEDPQKITDTSPVRRANILLPKLRRAINRHFFFPPTKIAGFPPAETVGQLAKRIKTTRDPLLP
jgi:hypothetical protein